jgi:hypothetical protein
LHRVREIIAEVDQHADSQLVSPQAVATHLCHWFVRNWPLIRRREAQQDLDKIVGYCI